MNVVKNNNSLLRGTKGVGVKSNFSNNKDFDVCMRCMPSSLYTPLVVRGSFPYFLVSHFLVSVSHFSVPTF